MLFGVTGCEIGSEGNWEPTSELNIEMQAYEGYLITPMYMSLNRAISLFKKTYPDVQVNVTAVPGKFDDPYYHELSARIMSGEGPDILFMGADFMVNNDVYKMQRAGAFEDLAEVLSREIDLDSGEYVRAVFDGAAFEGHQYLIPVSYQLPFFITTEETEKESGIDFADSRDTVAMLTQLGDYWEREGETAPHTMTYPRYIPMSPLIAGMEYGDRQTGEIQLDFDVLRQILDQWKRIAPYETKEGPHLEIGFPNSHPQQILEGLQNKTIVCAMDYYGYGPYLHTCQELGKDMKPRFYPWRNMEGGITVELTGTVAIRRGSPNAQNAWNLIKLALSEEAQRDMTDALKFPKGSAPVNKKAWEYAFQSMYSQTLYYEDGRELPPVAREYHDQFVKYQDEITGICMRFPMYREIFGKFDPYVKGTATFEECRKEAEDFMFIYLSE